MTFVAHPLIQRRRIEMPALNARKFRTPARERLMGQTAIQQSYRVLYSETYVLLDGLANAVADGTRKKYMESVATVALLIVDEFGMRKPPHTAAEDLLELVMRRYESASTLLTSNRPVEE